MNEWTPQYVDRNKVNVYVAKQELALAYMPAL